MYHIFVKSVNSRVFPDCWKLADVTLIPKCKNPTVKDFRPISLTPVVSRIFEKLVLQSVYASILPLFGPNQYAFKRHGSTDSALIRIHDSITNYLEDPKVAAVRMICLDLSKAFDMVPHSVLQKRFIDSNLSRGFVIWLRSYLNNRTQRLRLGGSFGPTTFVPSGVPQGSTIGPALFAAFMGTISVSSTSTLVVYADDITLIEPVFGDAGTDSDSLVALHEWIAENEMCINLKKSKQMIFYCNKSDDFALQDIDMC